MQARCRLFQSPERRGDGFLSIDDPLKQRGDNSILSQSLSIFAKCYPFLRSRISPSVVHSFPLCSSSGSATMSADSASRNPLFDFVSSTQSVINTSSISAFRSVYHYDPVRHVLAYKPVAKKVRTVPAPLAEEFRIIRRLPDNPLDGLLPLPTHPPDFIPGTRYTRERADVLDLDPANWLWPEELKLIRWLVLIHETAFAWDASERGRLDERYFPPVKIPTVPHTPWMQRNIPIPPAIHKQVIEIIKEKIASGVYEPSAAAYRSRWFCVVKKDGKSLRLVHDLQPLNAVTIRDAL
jgi:hypothetical protein